MSEISKHTLLKGSVFDWERGQTDYHLQIFRCPVCGKRKLLLYINGRIAEGGYGTHWEGSERMDDCTDCSIERIFA